MVARAIHDGPPRLNHGERITALEHRQNDADKRLERMEPLLTEIHQLLTGAKAVLWVAAKVGGWITLCCTVIGAGVAIYKVFH